MFEPKPYFYIIVVIGFLLTVIVTVIAIQKIRSHRAEQVVRLESIFPNDSFSTKEKSQLRKPTFSEARAQNFRVRAQQKSTFTGMNFNENGTDVSLESDNNKKKSIDLTGSAFNSEFYNLASEEDFPEEKGREEIAVEHSIGLA